MEVIFVKVYSTSYKYDNFVLGKNKILRWNFTKINESGENNTPKPSRRRIKVYVDGILAHYIVQEFKCSKCYCESFSRRCLRSNNGFINNIKFVMFMPQKQIIDFDWNDRISYMVRERCELEHTLSWLSTLGGAFSALGDYFSNCAEVAGKISHHQLLLALRMGDPNIASRCKLYLSLSLIQRQYFKIARHIIYTEFINAKNASIIDTRLLKMCQGIWSKLKYEYELHRKHKKMQPLQIVQ